MIWWINWQPMQYMTLRGEYTVYSRIYPRPGPPRGGRGQMPWGPATFRGPAGPTINIVNWWKQFKQFKFQKSEYNLNYLLITYLPILNKLRTTWWIFGCGLDREYRLNLFFILWEGPWPLCPGARIFSRRACPCPQPWSDNKTKHTWIATRVNDWRIYLF